MELEKESDSGNFFLLFFAIFIDLLGFGIIIPIMPYLMRDINPEQEGFLLATLLAGYSLAQFVSAPFWGRLSDKIGRRPVILVGLFGSSISFAIFGIVTTYPWYVISRVLGGIFTGASLPTARAYIADITPPEDRARRYGLLGAAFGIGFTFGPAIGSILSLDIFLIPGFPEQAAASFFAALLAVSNFILAYYRLPESLELRKSDVDFEQVSPVKTLSNIVELSKQRNIGLLLLIFGITTMIFSGFESIIPFYASIIDSRINEENIGFFFAFIGILVALFQSTLVSPTVDRLGEEGTISLALFLQIGGYILLGFSNNLITLGLVVIPLGLGTALLNPSINSAVSNRIPSDSQGSGLGINSSVGSLGRVVGPLYGGLLYDELSPASPFFIGAVFISIVLIFALLNLQKESVIEADELSYPSPE